MSGIYTSTNRTLSNGEGAAPALDVNARTIVVNPDGSNVGTKTPNGDSMVDDTNDALKVVLATGLSNLIDQISSHDTTNSIMNGTTALTPKFAVIDVATSGDNTLVTAVTSKKIRVVSLFLVSAGTVTARFESGTGGTALTGQMNLVANSGFCLPYNPKGWFETASGTLLNLELSGAVSVDGSLSYIEV